jgi:8-oxo-dGTP pyrophosphatase MutT (NUDIX family)
MAAGRTEYLNDPAAPKPNSLVPAAGVLAADADSRVLLQRRRDTGQWASRSSARR